MSDQLANGRPNEVAAALQARQLEVDRHGLEHSVMKYELEIERWKDNITKHTDTIKVTQARIAELDQQIARLKE
jgi:septal ring factor EnvC (AmiA/AmiB activator)